MRNEPSFDVVIPVGPNDINGLEEQIACTKKNIYGYRNIYLICSVPSVTVEGCTTIDENIFPFNKKTVEHFHGKHRQNGWYLQQLLKLYAGEVITGILNRYLVIDSDTYFLKPTTFIQQGVCMYNYGREYVKEYFLHMERLHPGLKKQHPDKSGICHHMMFETKYIYKLFNMVEARHKDVFYNVFLKQVNKPKSSGASEYEIYFNYMLKFHPGAIFLRKLDYVDCWLPNDHVTYISKHRWLEKWIPRRLEKLKLLKSRHKS